MECYTEEFKVRSNFPYPGRPVQFTTLSHARNTYAEFVQYCDKFGMGKPAAAFIYFGKADDVVNLNGIYLYPDYPDRIMESGPKGGVKIGRT